MNSIEMNFVVCLQQKIFLAEFTLDVWSLKRIQMFIKFRFCFKNQITSVTYVSSMPNFVMFSLMVFITKGSRKKKTDYLVTLIIFPLTPTHLPPRMTYDKSD